MEKMRQNWRLTPRFLSAVVTSLGSQFYRTHPFLLLNRNKPIWKKKIRHSCWTTNCSDDRLAKSLWEYLSVWAIFSIFENKIRLCRFRFFPRRLSTMRLAGLWIWPFRNSQEDPELSITIVLMMQMQMLEHVQIITAELKLSSFFRPTNLRQRNHH